ncbi:MAG: MDR family oxidoreductase [Myxococcota bacterium]
MRAWIMNDPKTMELRDVPESELPEGDVLIDVHYSTLNYKDALALTGRGKIVRSFPMVPGIDLSGVVAESSDASVAVGTPVVVNGHGMGEDHWGGYAERARVPGAWAQPIPEVFSVEDAMAIGTAGYTAALCVLAVEEGGAEPGQEEVLVTGATGGVGSVAVSLLARRGHKVLAVTGRPQHADALKALGAAEVVDRAELSGEKIRPLGKQRWHAAIDVAGSTTLAHVLSMTKYGGVVAATGLADGMDMKGWVTPFILRNVRLQGVDSVMTPRARRDQAWSLLAESLDKTQLTSIREVVGLEDVREKAADLLDGKVRGRLVVKVR